MDRLRGLSRDVACNVSTALPMNKFKQKYRIKSMRLPSWDYRSNGYYFVTICTKNKLEWFGNVVNTEESPCLALSFIGKTAQNCWEDTSMHFPFVKLDAFVVMPNHVHWIVIIAKTDFVQNNGAFVETLHATSLHNTKQMSSISPKSGSLSTIIRSYKSSVTKIARKIQPDFSWQPRFYEHIIRNEQSLNYIRNYILFNPEKWEDDKENINNISRIQMLKTK